MTKTKKEKKESKNKNLFYYFLIGLSLIAIGVILGSQNEFFDGKTRDVLILLLFIIFLLGDTND